MNIDNIHVMRDSFYRLSDEIDNLCTEEENFVLTARGEKSQFIRLNRSRIRQTGVVNDASLHLKIIKNNRTMTSEFTFSGDFERDKNMLRLEFFRIRRDIHDLPEDPYVTLPQDYGSTEDVHQGNLLSVDKAVETILSPIQGSDLSGYYAAGPLFQALASSAGQRCWFENRTFFFDYSLCAEGDRMVKGTYAGETWETDGYKKEINDSLHKLDLFKKSGKTISPGRYRVYFAPAAVADLVHMLSWGALSESSIRQGQSPLLKMRNENLKFSENFNFNEDFTTGSVPKFNEEGEIAAAMLSIIKNGNLTNTLISTRTEKEYGVKTNYASSWESPRAPVVPGGDLEEAAILETLDSGLYISNLHYLNWSDRQGGRVTGMTRYACFEVENGKLSSPIENMRFDETIFHYFGKGLERVTRNTHWIPNTDTYEHRKPGGTSVPGMIVNDFTFTL